MGGRKEGAGGGQREGGRRKGGGEGRRGLEGGGGRKGGRGGPSCSRPLNRKCTRDADEVAAAAAMSATRCSPRIKLCRSQGELDMIV